MYNVVIIKTRTYKKLINNKKERKWFKMLTSMISFSIWETSRSINQSSEILFIQAECQSQAVCHPLLSLHRAFSLSNFNSFSSTHYHLVFEISKRKTNLFYSHFPSLTYILKTFLFVNQEIRILVGIIFCLSTCIWIPKPIISQERQVLEISFVS